MREWILDAMDFKCPMCQTEFTEDDLQELCGEPFNGCCLLCADCGWEFSADVRFVLTVSSEPEAGTEEDEAE